MYEDWTMVGFKKPNGHDRPYEVDHSTAIDVGRRSGERCRLGRKGSAIASHCRSRPTASQRCHTRSVDASGTRCNGRRSWRFCRHAKSTLGASTCTCGLYTGTTGGNGFSVSRSRRDKPQQYASSSTIFQSHRRARDFGLEFWRQPHPHSRCRRGRDRLRATDWQCNYQQPTGIAIDC